jgi:hypothetical protein
MENIYYASALSVIGYADVINKTSVPRRVAPIFANWEWSNCVLPALESSQCLFPPFRLVDDLVIGGIIAPLSDFKEFIGEKVTSIVPKLPAVPQGMLWIDEKLGVHYGPQNIENNKLYELAAEKVKQGLNAFKSGNLEEALKCARWACAANQKSLKPIALEAAIYKIQENEPGFNLMKTNMLEGVTDAHYFNDEVDSLVKQYPLK